MKKGKKILIIALMAVVAIAGTIGGVALAQDEEEATTTPETERLAFLERVCEIYYDKTGVTIDADTLKDAFCQAGEEKMEQARNQFRQRLIDEGIFTEEQLTEWEEWLEARPDFPTEQFKNWLESRPDDSPRSFGFRNYQGKRFAFGFGYHLGQGFGGWCQPGNGAE
jgi:hypothetical protein